MSTSASKAKSITAPIRPADASGGKQDEKTNAPPSSIAEPPKPPLSESSSSKVTYKDGFESLKSKQDELDANLTSLKATLQRIHAIDIIEKKEAPLLLNSLLEGKELSAVMIQKVMRGYLSRKDTEYICEQIPHLINITEVRLSGLAEDTLLPFFGKFAPDTQVILNSFTRSHCKNWRIYSAGQTSVVYANQEPVFTDNIQLLNSGYFQKKTNMMPKKNFPGKIVVNVFSNKITGNTLVGQAIFDLAKFPEVKAGTEHEIVLPLKKLKKGLTIYDASGNAMTATIDQTFATYEANQKKYEEDCEKYAAMSTKDKDIKDDNGDLLHPEPQPEPTEFGTVTLKIKMPPAGLDNIFADFTEICGSWGSEWKVGKWVELDYTDDSLKFYTKPSDDTKILNLTPIEVLSIKDIERVSDICTAEDVGLFDEDGEPEDFECIKVHFKINGYESTRIFGFGEESCDYKGLWLQKLRKYAKPEVKDDTKGEQNTEEGAVDDKDGDAIKSSEATTVESTGDNDAVDTIDDKTDDCAE